MLQWFGALSRLCTASGVEAVPFDLARKPSQSFFQNQLSQTHRALLIARHYENPPGAPGRRPHRRLGEGGDHLSGDNARPF